MVEKYFKTAHTIARLRSSPAGPFLDEFGDSLHKSGYANSTIRGHLRTAAHLGAWMGVESISFDALDAQVVRVFGDHFAACRCSWPSQGDPTYAVDGARLFLTHLHDQGVVPVPVVVANRLPEVIERFEHWMLRHRGVTPSTLATYRPILVELLQKLDAPNDWTAATLRKFVSNRAARCGRSRAKTMIAAMRMLLRHLVLQGVCGAALIGALPTIANWRLSSLPVYLSPEDVERIVCAPDPATCMGRRDRAILLLLARLGLRAGDVAGLRMADVDWHAGTLLMSGKERRVSKLPLPQDVGDAILAYLADGRPTVVDEHVFLRVQAPIGKLRFSAAVSSIVCSAAKHAGVKLPRGGAHVLRHSMATALVRNGVPLSAVRVMLRHQSEETTAHYAKLDVAALRVVARPWPLEVLPC